MKFSILLFIIFGIKVRICDAVIYTLEIGDPITCECLIYWHWELSWTLQKVNGEKIPLITHCPYPYNNCTVQNYKGDIFLEGNSIVHKLTVHHVKQDMFRLICSPDYFREYTDNCILNVVDSFGADNGTTKNKPTYSAIFPSQMASTTPSPDVYLTTYPTLSFLRTTLPFLFSTTPKPATEQPINVAVVICVTALPLIGAVVIPTLCFCCCYHWKNRKGLQRQNEAMRDISNTPQLTPATVPGPDENDLCSTHVNPLVHPSNNTPTTQSPQHTTSIQSTAPNDSPPPYSSLLEIRVEPPPYTTLVAESYNCVSAPSQQAPNEPPPYLTRYTAQQQAPNEPPPPYSA